jgi:hypothetical protein
MVFPPNEISHISINDFYDTPRLAFGRAGRRPETHLAILLDKLGLLLKNKPKSIEMQCKLLALSLQICLKSYESLPIAAEDGIRGTWDFFDDVSRLPPRCSF